MFQTGTLAALVAVLGLASTLPGDPSGSDLRTTPAAVGPSADEPSAREAAADASMEGRRRRAGAGVTGGTRPDEVQTAQTAVQEAVREVPTLETTRTPVTTTTTGPPTAPAGGREIAVIRGPAIWLMHADGSGLGPLTDGTTRLWKPDWAPDGRRLVAGAMRSDATGDTINWLVIVSLDGTVTRLTGDGRYTAPKWSPDGSRIAFLRRFNTQLEVPKYDLWVMNADGSNERKLAADVGWDVSWAPDSSRLAYECGPQICIMRSDGADARPVPNTHNSGTPAWSPDGERLAIGTHIDAKSMLATIRLDGTDRRILADVFVIELDWSGDGRHLVYSTDDCLCGTSIWRMNADGSDRRRLLHPSTDDGSYFHPTWRSKA